MNRVSTSACIFLLASLAACGDDTQPTSDAAVSDASPDTPTPDGSPSSATLGPQADAHRSRCEFFCDGKGDPSDACLATQREECLLACQSRLALVDTPCATCIVDETFIETTGDEDSCRYFILEENESGPCASFCGGTSELSDRADRVARCRGMCAASAYGSRCMGDDLDSCTNACLTRTEFLSTGCTSCLIDESFAEDLNNGRCRFSFPPITNEECGGRCSAETAALTEVFLDRRCEEFCRDSSGQYSDGCPPADTERCLSACRSQVEGLNTGCTACVLDNGFVQAIDAESCRFSFAAIAGDDCLSFCAP